MVLAELESIDRYKLCLRSYLQANHIIFTQEETKEAILATLAKNLASCAYKNEDELFQAFIEREKIVTTGLGMGVAIPHARIQGQKAYHIAVALNSSGIPWHSIDKKKVRIIFAIIGPDDKQIQHLQILSSLADIVRENHARELLLTAKTPEQVLSVLKIDPD